MFWADRIAEELRGKGPQLVDDMKTPSGPIHVGALRGVIVHDLAFRALRSAGIDTRFTYCIDDTDPMDGLPASLDATVYQRWMGVPFHKIPAPDGSEQSYARLYANDFIDVMNQIGANPEIIWTSDIYASGKMDPQIRRILDHAALVDRIYQEISGSPPRPEGWVPFQPVCENCGKVGTTLATGWNGETVAYTCEPQMVKWAQGCGYQGRISPFGGTGKLPWKVEWPAKWAALGVTVEGEGSDHATAGGSRQVADAVARQILEYEPPYDIPYEFLLLGGRKMATSKGVGVTAREACSFLPPELLRFLVARPKPNQRIDFDPKGPKNPQGEETGDAIPKLFDEYDRCAKAFFEGTDPDSGRIFELSQLTPAALQPRYMPRFSTVATWVQIPHVDPLVEAAAAKGAPLEPIDIVEVEQRVQHARIWVERYAPESAKLAVVPEVPPQAAALTPPQRGLLREVISHLEAGTAGSAEELQNNLYTWGQALGLKSAETFGAVYLALLGKTRGPKAGWLITALDRQFVIDRFSRVIELT